MTTPTSTPPLNADGYPDRGQPYGSREHWTESHELDGTTRWSRHTWPLDHALEVNPLSVILEDLEHERPFTLNGPPRIVDHDGRPLMVVLGAEEYERLRAVREQMDELRDQPDDHALHPAYQGPGIGGDEQLLDLAPIREALGGWLDRYEKALEQPTAGLGTTLERRESYVIGGAVAIALAVTLPADDDDLVPIRVQGPPGEGAARSSWRWALAHPTPARGLFVRAERSWWGKEYSVTAGGCGLKLRGGFYSRQVAQDYAVAIAAAVPAVDWRIWKNAPDETTPAVMDVIRAENARWRHDGRQAPPTTTWTPAEGPAPTTTDATETTDAR